MCWTLQNLKDVKTSSKYCTIVQYLVPLRYAWALGEIHVLCLLSEVFGLAVQCTQINGH
jgi:hypothetical protein